MRAVFRTSFVSVIALVALLVVNLGISTCADAAQTEITVWTAFCWSFRAWQP